MSDLPVDPDHFIGGQRVTPIDTSEGGAPLASLVNAAAQSAEASEAMTGAIDLSAATAAVVKAASRKVTTNAGAARAYTLPDFASAPDGWEHTFISLDAATNEMTITHAGADTINGIAGDITLTTGLGHEWVKVFKAPGATGWHAIGGTLILPA